MPNGPAHDLRAEIDNNDGSLQLTVRDLIARWGAKRRGYWWVRTIIDDLDGASIDCTPRFDSGPIDNVLVLTRRQADPSQSIVVKDPPQDSLAETAAGGVALPAHDFPSARTGLVSVRSNDSLTKVQSSMMANDFSQLAVLHSKHRLTGVVSWESIARAKMHRTDVELKDCIVHADVISLADDLLPRIASIVENGCIFTEDRSSSICGIITTADLSLQFQRLAEPFLVVGVAEASLRSLAQETFSDEEILAARQKIGGGESRPGDVTGLSFGELSRLFNDKELWDRLALPVDPSVFRKLLDDVRAYRNTVMHFRVDEESAEVAPAVRNLITWLGQLRS